MDLKPNRIHKLRNRFWQGVTSHGWMLRKTSISAISKARPRKTGANALSLSEFPRIPSISKYCNSM
jgi:hypothetical protein